MVDVEFKPVVSLDEARGFMSGLQGGPDTAHQLLNTGSSDLKYLGISTMQDPEVVEYSDSGKFAAIAVAPGKDFMSAHLLHVGKPEDARDYWEGETRCARL